MKIGKYERHKARITLVQAHDGRKSLEQNRHRIDPKRLRRVEAMADYRFEVAKRHCKRIGVSTDIPIWRQHEEARNDQR